MNRIKFFLFLIIIFLLTVVFGYFKYQGSEIKTIKSRGVLLVGTTGDYCPMSCYNQKTKSYYGFDIALAEDLAKFLGVKTEYVPTSWPTLMQDTIDKKFDIAISGITVTDERKKQALMTEGYLENGKTVLCRKEDAAKYLNLQDINKPNVRVMENPGGLNEKFVRENLPDVQLIIHNINYEIPGLIAENKADVMITEISEAIYYSGKNKKLAAPLINKPFTRGQIGMLIPNDNKILLFCVNNFIKKEKKSGRIDELKEKYIFLKP